MPDLTLNWWERSARGGRSRQLEFLVKGALWGAHNFVSEAFKELSG
jgi:hypothetical protein